MPVCTVGLDHLGPHLARHHRGARVGVVAHPASVDSQGRHIVTLLVANPAWRLTALFGPEHGITGTAADMEHVDGTRDASTGLPVHSLYGPTPASLRPTRESLQDVDLLVIDLQDIGTRYYTYIYTMAFCLAAAADAGIPVIVCDRPNPIGGQALEGSLPDPRLRSFVGWYPLPVRHGMTIGELARYFNAVEQLGTALTVLPMTGWQRSMHWDDTALRWINPSPNMRSLTAALLYPGACLLEATNISEGRGTETPFECCGAPWIDADRLVQQLATLALPGLQVTPTHFTPTARKFTGQVCHGVRCTITDRACFPAYRFGLCLLWCLATHHRQTGTPQHFGWRTPAGNPPHSGLDAGPYEFVTDHPAIDLLTGDTQTRTVIDAEASWPTLAQLVGNPSPDFLAARAQYLLY